MCHQSVGLIARHAESLGIPTVCLTSARSITQAVNPPRAAFVDFPLGHTAGPALDARQQRGIVGDALRCLETHTAPGMITDLPYAWPDDRWKATAMRSSGGAAGADTRTTRDDEPVYQREEDRIAAQTAGAVAR